MKVKDMIEWLKTQDQDRHVLVVCTNYERYSYSVWDEYFDPNKTATIDHDYILLGIYE